MKNKGITARAFGAQSFHSSRLTFTVPIECDTPDPLDHTHSCRGCGNSVLCVGDGEGCFDGYCDDCGDVVTTRVQPTIMDEQREAERKDAILRGEVR